MPQKLVIVLLFLSFSNIYAQKKTYQAIPFVDTPPEINGDLSEWKELSPLYIQDNSGIFYRNYPIKVYLAWDNEWLYVAADVRDGHLCRNEKGNNNPRLYLNDAIEIYIDTQNDSDAKMDINDYQFIIDIVGQYVIFKGDKHLIQNIDQYSVPKDYGNTTMTLKTAAFREGSMNDLSQKDKFYQIEIAIPWAGLGIVARENTALAIDICIDDMDTVVDFAPLPGDFESSAFHYFNLIGKHDFGYPKDWTAFRLTGKASWTYNFSRSHPQLGTWLLIAGIILVGGLLPVLFIQYRRITFLKSLPTHSTLQATATLEEGEKPDILSHPLCQSVRAILTRDIADDVSISELANLLNTNVRQLQRIFKDELAITPKQLITIIRLEAAAELLQNKDMTVAEVAYQVGFSSPAYFTSVFKKYFNATPKHYRGGRG